MQLNDREQYPLALAILATLRSYSHSHVRGYLPALDPWTLVSDELQEVLENHWLLTLVVRGPFDERIEILVELDQFCRTDWSQPAVTFASQLIFDELNLWPSSRSGTVRIVAQGANVRVVQ